MIKKIFYLALVFASGVVAQMHLSKLLLTNQSWEGSWFGVIAAVLLAIFFGAKVLLPERYFK